VVAVLAVAGAAAAVVVVAVGCLQARHVGDSGQRQRRNLALGLEQTRLQVDDVVAQLVVLRLEGFVKLT
jgi:hypothetical protein